MFTLPQRKDKAPISIEYDEFKSIVLLGANGSGKTRLSVWLEKNIQNVHRISAQKSLTMPKEIRPTTIDKALEEFLYGTTNDNKEWLRNIGKRNGRWGNNPATFLLNDFEKLLTLLHTEEYEASVEFKDSYEDGKETKKPKTKLDIIQNIWESVLPHRKLRKRAGTIEVSPVDKTDDIYNASEMSDGERLVFYFIGEVVCAPENSIIIIDEPENHLHTSIIKKLWDSIEMVRKDCKLVFLTHDIDFAITRNNSKIIWIKSYEGNEVWDYDVIGDEDNIPSEAYLEIIGSRNPILFIEGDKSSIDYHLYQYLFKEYTIVPIGSCEKVIETTKAFNDLSHFHNLTAKGIIDRDRRTEEEIQTYAEKQIFIPQVAEVENLFIVEEVVKAVATILRKDSEKVFHEVKNSVIKLFEKELEKQAYQYATYSIRKKTIQQLDIKHNNFEEFNINFKNFFEQNSNETIYKVIYELFNQYLKEEDYNNIIKVFNFKGLIPQSRVAEKCGLNNKNYMNFIKDVLKESSSEGEVLRAGMEKYISLIER
ncbi:uncharacterized protein DUF4435 [Streptohalobacillus salinus]|uniref:Uncharacterized protein DUF4435 n=1 Tax=Streptohalobacillus salinus TaxID=621096 RepID=A0A2V3W6W7_9BACI|nr:DUF4435 domain-containing protein [Streptohalobacillus salinus]PXW89770.1 uncharacterized protein DUF4435 [Streptohalobacillus salinus]